MQSTDVYWLDHGLVLLPVQPARYITVVFRELSTESWQTTQPTIN